jgi:hypothetical protein
MAESATITAAVAVRAPRRPSLGAIPFPVGARIGGS